MAGFLTCLKASPLRASSDHRFIVGALRAQRPYQLPRHPLLKALAPLQEGVARLSFTARIERLLFI